MSKTQPSVASYFGKRKRIVTDDVYKAKLLKVDDNSILLTNADSLEVKTSVNEVKGEKGEKVNNCTLKNAKSDSSTSQQYKEERKIQVDIRDCFKTCCEEKPHPCLTSPVKFQYLGSLSPAKKNNQKTNSINNESQDLLHDKKGVAADKQPQQSSVKSFNFSKTKEECSTDDIIRSAKQLVSKIKSTQKKLSIENNQKKALSLKEIKDKLLRSSKLNELKKSINKINEHAEELIELEKNKLTGTQPKLSKFKSIEVEVPISPKKNALYSPLKQRCSPCKPAYERFASLVDTTSSLPLPFGFQRLYELFKAVDTVCSMLVNRGEVITFNKLKSAVEEMTRKNFTTRHLGQVASVFPGAFSFHQEKLRNFGSTSKVDKYELVVIPTIPNTKEVSGSKSPISEDDIFKIADRSIMTPKIIKARRETFYNNLLERTKDCHEEFLKTLDPPITINRNELKRWHPNFMVDLIPDIHPQELPQPPASEGPSSAKDILERAKNFISSNARLQKALEAVAADSNNFEDPASKISAEVKEKVDARLKNPLKGIPNSLLEKVRARQAAKALDAMKTSPDQEKEILMYGRLPDIARIVRTVFINEQKGVILMEIVVEKVQFSYNRNLSLSDVEAHIRLLTNKLPEWLSIVKIRYSDYLKISRNVDVASVMTKLKKIVEDKKQETRVI